MDKDEIKGKGEQIKGAAKEHIGRATGDEELEGEGMVDKAKGNVQETYGKVKDKAKRAADELKD